MPSRDATDRLFDGRYRLVEQIGSGGMARVWLAEDATLGRNVAIKILAERYAEDEQFIERFRREAQAAAGLNHPNVVAIYDRGEAEGTYYIAMEFLDGETLKDVIRREAPLDPESAIDDALQILQALRFAHRNGVVHRDIKPHNIIVGRDGRLKVTDFGIARAGASQMTEVGSIIGTAQYLSPEQARGQAAQPAADLYSLGVVLFEMLTGRVPFEGESAVAIAMQHVSDPPPAPRSLNPAIPPALEQVVLRALAKDPGLRYATADEMAADLDRVRRGLRPSAETQSLTQVIAAGEATRIANDQGTRVWSEPVEQVVEERPARPTPIPPRRRPIWPWVLLVVLLVAAAGLGAYAAGLLDDEGTGSVTPTTATVPSTLVGVGYDEAATRVRDAGLQPRRRLVYSGRPNGQVVDTDPQGGATAPRGDTVVLKVSKGRQPIPIPNVVDRAEADAMQTLRDAGFKPRVTGRRNDAAAEGLVIDQAPDEGQTRPRGAEVQLTVSKGPEQVEVPRVEGQTLEAAVGLLESSGLVRGVVTRDSSRSVPNGQVVSQSPSGGSTADKGSGVDLVVSSGPPRVEVPDVIGQTEDDATSALEALGFHVLAGHTNVGDSARDGIVIDQSPRGGTLREGSNVRINVGQLSSSGSIFGG